MTIHLEPDAVRAAWAHGTSAQEEIDAARGFTDAASGASTGPLGPALAHAAGRADGALATASAVLGEFATNVEGCIAEFQATDGGSAGAFNELGAGQ
ncbi:hypothetical protein RDV89_03280 [Nocardioides zeae]|uniref:ESX-1 secretion-associated protein n=1 Tax=Nocardioides imazamoxiresistens TaxID=3231893 RepID=A0ABU3PT55_9ACTN|nr:hypothetical protein [Nocardioides zeae]MDT9592071.1 hypothetical protein [Nocardioides zeae]